MSGGIVDHNSQPWSNGSLSIPQRNGPTDVSDSSLVYYYESAGHERQLVFKNFNSSMNGNYTCTTSDESKSVIIKDGKIHLRGVRDVSVFCVGDLTVVFQLVSQIEVHGVTGSVTLDILLAGIPSPSANNVTWYFNGQELTSQLASSLSFTFSWVFGDPPFFRLRGFVRTMEGNYEARVTTSAGTSSDSFYLNIECK